jgi:hypothetical protein
VVSCGVVGDRIFQPEWRRDREGDDRRELTGDGEMFCVASDGPMKKRCGAWVAAVV